MFNNIGVENFRIFKDYTEFELAPITVLTGSNNSGKSSLIKLLSLLKHSFNKENGINKLDFDGGNHKLGTFDNVLSWDNNSKQLKINLDFPLEHFDEKFILELIYVKDKEDGKLVSFKVFNEKRVLVRLLSSNQDIKFLFDDERNIESDIFYTIDLEYLKYTMNGNKKPIKKNNLFFNYYLSDKDDSHGKENIEKKYYPFLKLFETYFSKYYYEDVSFGDDQIESGKYDFLTEWKGMILSIYSDELVWYFNGFRLKEDEKITKIEKIAKDYFQKEQKKEDFNKEKEVAKMNEFILNIPNIKISINPFYAKDVEKFIQENIEKGLNKILYSINSIDHLTARRGSQERILSNKSDNEIDEIVKEFFLIHIFWKDEYKLSDPRYDNFLEKSFKILNIKGELIVEREHGVLSKIYIKKRNKDILLSDLGFGYSQIIPILLKIILISDKKENEWIDKNPYDLSDLPDSIVKNRHKDNKDNSDKNVISSKSSNIFDDLFEISNEYCEKTKYPILIVEEPEANLHPNLQSRLADVLVLAHKTFGIHFILETHSEYLIRKLQYLTVKKEITLGDVNIHYFNDDEYVSKEEPKVKKIQIDEFGALSDNFGPGFYDEATNLKFELMKLNQAQNN